MDGVVKIGIEADTKSFDAQIKELEYELKQIDFELSKSKELKLDSRTIDNYKLRAEKLTNQLVQLRKKQSEIDNPPTGKILKYLQNMGKETEKNIKKVGRWALAIFGIRSAYLFVRQAMSTLSQYDEQLAVNVQYISYLLASTLKPIIETIVNLAYKALAYINAIAQAWFGINLFANASMEQFTKQNKALGGSVKQAEKLKKSLAGFDEMNILGDTSSSDSGASGGGAITPNFPKMEDVPIPSWMQWIIDNGDLIAAIIGGIIGAIVALKLGFGILESLGIGLAIMGIIYAIQKLIDFIKDPTFENFIGILEGIALAVIGVAIAVGAWPVAIGAAVALVVIEIVKHFDEIMNLFNNLISWMDENVLGGLRVLFGPVGDILYAPIKFFVELAKGAFESFYGGIKRVIDGVVKIFRGDFLGGIKDIFGGLLSIMTAPLQGFLKAVFSIIPIVFNAFREIGTTAGSIIGSAFKSVVNGVLNAVETILNSPIRAINGLINVINAVPGINLRKLSTFRLPRLAKGGILNYPGKGVYTGNAIAGEAGREFYMPLQDEQMLNLVGEAIGKYVNVNLTNITNLDGRQIARKVEQIKNNNNFVLNK